MHLSAEGRWLKQRGTLRTISGTAAIYQCVNNGETSFPVLGYLGLFYVPMLRPSDRHSRRTLWQGYLVASFRAIIWSCQGSLSVSSKWRRSRR